MATINSINNNSGTLTVANGLTVTAGGATVTAGGLTVTAGATSIGVTGNNSFTVASGTSQIAIGNDAVAKTVYLGNTTGATALNLNAGTGNFNVYVDSGAASQIINSSGNVNFPLTSAFNYYLGTADTNATGDNLTATIGGGHALTKVYDQGSNCSTGGLFTAPVTGKYFFSFTVLFSSLQASSKNCFLYLVTSAATYVWNIDILNAFTTSDQISLFFSSYAPMTAADTCSFQVLIGGNGSNGITIGSGQGNTYISGMLVC
jgi:hypothetical protein